jgi:hypothetical protein
MKVYNYNKETKEFTTQSIATANPLEKGKYLIPANATTKEPLPYKENFAVCFNETKNEWEYIEDNRNKTVYETSTKQELKIDYLGAIKAEHTLLVPKEYDKWDDATKSWVEDIEAKEKHEEAQAKLQKEKELSELVIDHNTVLYDAHGEALGNMATVIAIANATYNRAVSVGINGTIMDLVDAYNYVYKNQTVTWKGADNKPHTVQLESLVEASQKAMTAKAEILFKY